MINKAISYGHDVKDLQEFLLLQNEQFEEYKKDFEIWIKEQELVKHTKQKNESFKDKLLIFTAISAMLLIYTIIYLMIFY